MLTTLTILGAAIILGLAGYATLLLLKVRKQQQQQVEEAKARKEQADTRRESVLGDIRYIALAMTEDRCEISEGVVRIARLFDVLSLTDRVSPDYPALFTHFERIKDHPIMDARQALPKQERMRLDFERMKSEAEFEQAILDEAKRLSDFKVSNH
ncbi:DUF2489 domain-containing protein [Shewanella cyperi]|uniref:DUF2489 domain-containing protein n=1 Tax=Shewanella cyperi TaxID=2814292 RepID=A0A974XKM2_9GAMM|nr:DUF2489 domain-containing protein [Shewanella cyperi]QSX30185.1 DUF2489 domain-containing protein [Shewanella cyperi]QSX40957.1 DUF2489 domain-containing protein [Shewanella cyperi]